MTDRELRGLDRAWRSTGATQEEARLLLERLRSGDLGEEQLLFATLLGSAAARVALNEAELSPPEDIDSILSLVLDLGPVARLRAVVAVAREDVRRLATPFRERALAAATAMLSCPCARHRQAARDIAEEARALHAPHEVEANPGASPNGPLWHELGSPWFAVETAAEDPAFQPYDTGSSWRDSKTWRTRLAVWPQCALVAASARLDVGELFSVVSHELIPWVLRSPWLQEWPARGRG